MARSAIKRKTYRMSVRPRPIALNRLITSIVISISITLPGCAIFDMKDPESPLVGGVTEDPLNIGDVLSIARGSAANMDYRDYFADNVRFEYPPVLSVNGRDAVINMLNHLRPRASLVEWQVDKGERRVIGHNRQIVENVPYIVYSGGAVICAGLADFTIVMELDWVISYWKDVPDGGYVPFFEP